MPTATGVSPALRILHIVGDDPTARADFRAAMDQEEALELELRGPDGAVIATESIGISDTHYLREVARSALAEFDDDDEAGSEASLEFDVAFEEPFPFEPGMPDPDDSEDSEPPEHPRYQIQIRLVDHDAIP